MGTGFIRTSIVNPPELKIGDVSGGNYTEFSETGDMRHRGDATIWDDLTGSLTGRRLTSTSGTVDYNYEDNSITMQPGGDISDSNDRLIFNFQKPHGAKPDSEMRLHIHWKQADAAEKIFTVQYRIQDNSQVVATEWTTATSSTSVNNVFTYPGTGSINQITRLVNVDLSGHSISSTIEFRLARTDSNSGNVEAVFVDAHIEYDSRGSETEYSKHV